MSEKSHVQPLRMTRFYRRIWRIWKERRFRRFVAIILPQTDDRLLDIGGYPFNWFSRGNIISQVDVMNLELAPIEGSLPVGAPEIRAIAGDARATGFPDASYDIVFSNSVIEHVGTLEDQMAFAREARRIGRKLWIQTPARSCPIEPHYLGLAIHWFPTNWHVPLARWTSVRGLTGSATVDDLREIARHTRLMSKREFTAIFPDCDIWTERLLGIIPKSYVAIRKD